jgi:hypothetical protein
MVLRKVSRLTSFAGILGAVAILPLACGSKFEGCKASRTCPPPAQGGEGGEGGESDTGGSSGSGGTTGGSGGSSGSTTGGTESGGNSGSGGSSGSAGTAGSDEGGSGGGGDDTDPPTIVSFTPVDGATDVERDVTITVEMSEPIDASTVTNTSVALRGPNGNVPGALSVNANVISFVPDTSLRLMSPHTLTIADSIADLAGNTLTEPGSAEFQVRDGRFGPVAHPFGTSISRLATNVQQNGLGDLVVGMETPPSRARTFAALYNAVTGAWTSANELPGAYLIAAGIDDSRRAVVTWWSSMTMAGWYRATTGNAWLNIGALAPDAFLGVTPAGKATAIWYDTPNAQFTSQTLDLSSESLGEPNPLALTDTVACRRPLASRERLAFVCSRFANSMQELVVTWKIGTSWGTPEPLASAADIQSLAVDSDAQGNLAVVWREGDEIRSRFYEQSRGEWTPAEFVSTTSTTAQIMGLDISSGHAILAVNSFDTTEGAWTILHDADTGWLNASRVRLDEAGIGYPIALSADSAGNALAVWQSELKYRRYVAGVGWQAASSLQTNVDPNYVFAAGAPDGSVLVVANDVETNPNGIPLAARFE